MHRNLIADRLMIAAAAAIVGISGTAGAQAPAAKQGGPEITPALVTRPVYNETNWGILGAPVAFGHETTPGYTDAEPFAGPNKFGDGKYYHGILPNGKIVNPAGTSIPVGMNPLGSTLTPDGKFLIVTNDDERDGGIPSLQNPALVGGYSLTVVDTSTMTVTSQITTAGKLFIGLQAVGAGPYTLYASGGGDNQIKL